MKLETLAISHLPAWAKLNNVTIDGIAIEDIEGKGKGFTSSTKLDSREVHDIELLRIPKDLVLNHEFIEEWVKIDKHFRELRDAVGGKVRHISDVCELLVTDKVIVTQDGYYAVSPDTTHNGLQFAGANWHLWPLDGVHQTHAGVRASPYSLD
jgi:hypothetical protein